MLVCLGSVPSSHKSLSMLILKAGNEDFGRVMGVLNPGPSRPCLVSVESLAGG